MVVLENVNHAALSRHEYAIGTVVRVRQHHRSHRANLAVFVNRLPAGPLEIWKGNGARQRQRAVDGISDRAVFGQLADLDVAERDQVAVILQADVALRRLAEVGEVAELALRNALVPIFVALAEVVVADAIHGDFALLF